MLQLPIPNTRMTRSRTRNQPTSFVATTRSNFVPETLGVRPLLHIKHERIPVTLLPRNLTVQHTGSTRKAHALLLRKQQLLQATDFAVDESPAIIKAVRATLVFAAHHAGTAVCIAPEGLLLTAAHCIAESLEELALAAQDLPWLIMSNGCAV
jgi:hypothetical protein